MWTRALECLPLTAFVVAVGLLMPTVLSADESVDDEDLVNIVQSGKMGKGKEDESSWTSSPFSPFSPFPFPPPFFAVSKVVR